jgi:MoaA/NifB/PqqE/SkfB family radical SAM enzyme
MPGGNSSAARENNSLSYDTKNPPKDIHMGEPGFFHKLFRLKKLEGVFLFITSKCNSKCSTCFYHDKLNSDDDMSFDEIRRISETSPKFDKLWLSGGEPFLRKDLVEIITLFYENNGVRVINLPTNGLLEEKIVSQVSRLIDSCPKLTVHLNFSLDGLGRTHDRIRGVPGNFTKTINTMMKIKSKFKDNPRLLQNVATVITPAGYNELFDVGAYLLNKDLVATHFYEIVRGNPKDPKTKSLTRSQVKALRIKVQPLIEKQAENLFNNFTGLKKKFAKLFFMGFIKFVNDIQDANYDGPSDWGMNCTAGKTTFVIDHNGDFRSCEMRPPIGNLRDYGFNLTNALYSDAMRREIEEIGGGSRANCWCTHGCWVMSSMKFNPLALLFRIPSAYRRSKKYIDPDFTLPEIDTAGIESYRK